MTTVTEAVVNEKNPIVRIEALAAIRNFFQYRGTKDGNAALLNPRIILL